MTKAVLEAITRQIGAEFNASFSYLSMAAWCEHHKLMGAGRWLRAQSLEEHGHAMKLFEPRRGVGAVIGKSLASCTEGRHLVPILVSLR